MSLVSLDTLVASLESLGPLDVTLAAVTERLTDGRLDEASLAPYLHWRDDKYARNLVHRCDLFDVILLCWKPGQATPVHNHSGQRGWVQVLRGQLEETSWAAPGGGALPDLALVDVDDDGVGHGLRLERTGHGVVDSPDTVVTVDRERAIHQLGNPDPREPTVSLHVYSRPHDSCLAFDPEQQTCRRVALSFDTVPEGAEQLPRL